MNINMGVPTLTDFWLIIVISVITAFIVTMMAIEYLHILQLSGYKLAGLFDWMQQSKFASYGRLIMITVLSGMAVLITNVLLTDMLVGRALKYISILFLFIFSAIYIINIFNVPQKKPIKYTKRMNRIIGCFAVLAFLICVGLMYISVNFIPYFTPGGAIFMPLLVPLIVALSHLVTSPVEKIISNTFVRKAKAKLYNKDLIVVGITGSYGKTSVKTIIANILAEKYKVCASPFSYNTPLGLSKTILENLADDDQVFIAEMGARNVGDIAELCNMVKPQIGVITGIGNQHLATFKTIDNLVKTKSEIVRYIEQNNGKMIFNVDSEYAEKMYKGCSAEKKCVGQNVSKGIWADNIECNSKGSTFTLHISDKKADNVHTILLGEHNISNILVGVAVAVQLGLSMEQIVNGIESLTPVAHRLAIVPSTNSLVVIDDAYNASVEGSKVALNVLSKFDGKKIVITSGFVELGKEQFNSNFELGRQMATVCDYVIINGVINYEAIYSGLKFGGFDVNKIIRAGTLNQASSMLSSITNPGDVVLFENDLPDNYV